MYDRRIGDHTLNFEASGALMKASLVMRDRETDSWWSIMTSSAIGGELEGAELDEMPVSEKTTWGDWTSRHPETLVLSVDGTEHEAHNPYDGYFASEGTFRDLAIADSRLAPKQPIFSFWWNGQPYAASHDLFEGGRVFDFPDAPGRKVLLYRSPGSSMFASSGAWMLDDKLLAEATTEELLAARTEPGFSGEPIDGFDTFWYSWVAINTNTTLLE